MKVPARRLPQTRVSEQQRGFARAVPGLDVTPITKAIEGFQNQLQDEQYDREKFAANKRLMDEINELQLDFEERRRDPEISPIDFADTTNASYKARHQILLDELRGEGFDEEIIEDLDLKLGTVRQGFREKAVGHQFAALTDRANNEADDLGQSVSQYISTNSAGYASGRDMMIESIMSMPDLTEAQKEAKKDAWLGILRDTGMKRLVIEDPQYIIDTLDPQGLTAPYRAPAVTGGAINVQGLDSDRSTVATTLSTGGLSPQVVAGFLGNFDVEGGYGGVLGDGGTASGIGQWREERRDNFKRMFGKEPHQATKEEQAQFVLWELDNPAEAGMTPIQVAAIRNADTAEEAAELIDKFYERSSGEHRSRRTAAATGYANSVGTTNDPVQLVDIPASTATPQSEVLAGGLSLAPTVPQDVKTGNALLDDLNGPERLQALAWAREQLNRVHASRKAEMDVILGNAESELLNNGETAQPLPTKEEVLASLGPVEGPQRWARLQKTKDTGKAMQVFRTQSAEDIQRRLDALRPQLGSPAYETEMQIYSAADAAATRLLAERQSDPAAYAIKYFPSVSAAMKKGASHYYAELDRVYETLGIDPNRAPLLSGEATQQIAADYKFMNPAQRLNFMRENYAGMGEDRFRRFVSNMEGTTAQEDARIYMLLRTYPRPNGEWALIYQQVLEGREAMAKDPARRPPTEKLNEQFRKEALDAINSLNYDASAAIQEAAAAIYVAKNGDPVKINRPLYQQSLKAVLGGSLPVSMGRDEATDFTILPPRVTEPQFRTWIERQTFESLTRMSIDKRPPRYGDLKTLALTEDIVDHGVFVMAAPGQYMIKMTTDGKPLMTSQGRPFVVNIRTEDVLAAPGPQQRRVVTPTLRGVGR